MQHSALRRRPPPAVMRHRAEAAKNSASLRPPVPPTAQTVTGLSEPFFCFFAANLPPPSSLLPTRRSHYRRHRHCHLSAGTAQQSILQQPLPSPSLRTRNSRERHHIVVLIAKPTPREDRKWGHWARNAPLIRDFPQRFRASPPALQNTPLSRRRPARPAASLRAKTPSISRFLPSDLHLCPFLPIFAPIHVRKTSHPPSSSGLGLDSSPRPAAAIGGENLSLPRQRGAN